MVAALLNGCATPPTPPQPEQTAAPTAVRPARAGVAAPLRAADLLAATSDAVAAMFGPAGLRRGEADAEVWLYASRNGCRLDVVLFREAHGLVVAHAATRPAAGQTESGCLAALVAR